ncbi:hypothetical protein JCM19235_5489 [Vibrio maritimus]|uniref:Uncharacterized protein n=1 Tax=Vibrio maritimus TaxID=990268 RepID=A0A090RNE3_9VIBR|nr:hypothetical protein JCM19235_5489 [Vibrio maritimus]
MFVKASPLLLAVCIAVTPSVFAEEAASQPQTDNQAQTSTTSESSSKYEATLNKFKQADATLPFFENAYGYAVFPTVGKGDSVSVARMAKVRFIVKVHTLAIRH